MIKNDSSTAGGQQSLAQNPAMAAYWNKVAELQKRDGIDRGEAMKQVNQMYPQIRREMVAAANSRT